MKREDLLSMHASVSQRNAFWFVLAIVMMVSMFHAGVLMVIAQSSLNDIGQVRDDIIGVGTDYADQRAQVDALAAQAANVNVPKSDVSFFSVENPTIWFMWILLCAFFFLLVSIKRFVINKLQRRSLDTVNSEKNKIKVKGSRKTHNEYSPISTVAPQISRTLRIKVRKLSMRTKSVK